MITEEGLRSLGHTVVTGQGHDGQLPDPKSRDFIAQVQITKIISR